MEREQRLFLVPPKLQRGLLLAGLRVGEWLAVLALVVLCFTTRRFQMLVIPIAVYLLCCRPIDNRNALDFFRVRFRYCISAQKYVRKEMTVDGKKTAHRKSR